MSKPPKPRALSVTRDDALKAMGLPIDASDAAVKRRFEELALGTNGGIGMHPDHGGTVEQMHQLIAVYRLARSSPVTAKQGRRLVRRDTIADIAEIVVEAAGKVDHPKARVVQAFAKLLLEKLKNKG